MTAAACAAGAGFSFGFTGIIFAGTAGGVAQDGVMWSGKSLADDGLGGSDGSGDVVVVVVVSVDDDDVVAVDLALLSTLFSRAWTELVVVLVFAELDGVVFASSQTAGTNADTDNRSAAAVSRTLCLIIQ